MTLGFDLSDHIVRAVVVDAAGHITSRGDQAPDQAGLVASAGVAAARAQAGATVPITAMAVSTTLPGDHLSPELAATLTGVVTSAGQPRAVAAGTAAALAEQWCGAARGMRDVIAFGIGEHVTAGVLLGGQPLLGAHGLAGSAGWMAVNPVEREDYRRLGSLEAELAAAGIVRRLIWRVNSGDRSTVVDGAGDAEHLTADMVFQGARAGDVVCVSVVRDTAKYVGMAVSNMASVLDPEVIVLGGSIAVYSDLMLELVRTECARWLRPAQAERLRVVPSTLGGDAVAIGAARAAREPA